MKLRYLVSGGEGRASGVSSEQRKVLQFLPDDNGRWTDVPVVDAAAIAAEERFHSVVEKVAVDTGQTPLAVVKIIEAYNQRTADAPR